MKQLSKLLLSLIIMLMLACSGGGGGDDGGGGGGTSQIGSQCDVSATEAIVGCWVTELCSEVTTNPPLSRNMVLTFNTDGSMSQHVLFYTNLMCQGDPASNTNPLYPESYDFIADKMMQSGVTARVVDYQQDRGTFVQHTYGVAYIDGDRLCFGDGDFNAAVGGFKPPSNTISGAPDALDFTSCVTRIP